MRPLSGCFDRYDHRLGAVGVARQLNEVRVGKWRRHLTPYPSCDTTQIGQRGLIAAVSAALLLALLAAAPGGAARPYNVPDLRPWRPSLAIRFTSAMLALGHPVSDASDTNGHVVAAISGVSASDLPAIRRAAATAGRRVSRTCRCRMHGYEVRARVPGRGVVVVASS